MARPRPFGARLNLLMAACLLPLPFALFQPVSAMMVDMAGIGVLVLGAWLTRHGVWAHDEYAHRIIARRPAIPRKIFGAVAAALGTACLVYGGAWVVPSALGAGALAGVLHLLAFGVDPLRNKGIAASDAALAGRIAEKVAQAEALLAQMRADIAALGARDLDLRLARFEASAQDMFRKIEADPREMNAARRYLGVYLEGARDATAGFAQSYLMQKDPALRGRYLALLDDLEGNITRHSARMLRQGEASLDLDIELLRERLAREQIPTPTPPAQE